MNWQDVLPGGCYNQVFKDVVLEMFGRKVARVVPWSYNNNYGNGGWFNSAQQQCDVLFGDVRQWVASTLVAGQGWHGVNCLCVAAACGLSLKTADQKWLTSTGTNIIQGSTVSVELLSQFLTSVTVQCDNLVVNNTTVSFTGVKVIFV